MWNRKAAKLLSGEVQNREWLKFLTDEQLKQVKQSIIPVQQKA